MLRTRRVPVVTQMSAVECGAACLAMILGYHGRSTRVAECRERLGAGRDGATARGISQAARDMGLRVKAYTVETDQFAHVPLPAIAHWNFNHFVVVERWSPQWVEVVDPAFGRRRVPAAEFGKSFTGVVLTFEPGAGFDEAQDHVPPSGLRLVLRTLRVRDVRSTIAQVFLASFLLQFFALGLPVFTKVIVDGVLRYQTVELLPILGLGMVTLVVAQSVMGYLRAALLVYLQGRLDSRLMTGFFDHLLHLPYSFFQQRTSGDLLQRLTSNMTLREALSGQTVSVLLDGTFVVLNLVFLFAFDVRFGLVASALGLLQVALLLGTARRIHGLMQRELAAQAESTAYSVEALRGIAMLKAAASEGRALDRWTNLFLAHLNVTLERSHVLAVIETAMNTVRTASPLLVLYVGAYAVLNGSMTLGTVLALNSIVVTFLAPISSLVNSVQRLQLVRAHLERITDVLAAEPERRSLAATTPRFQGAVELRNVGFRYSPDGPWVVRNVSLRIEPGQKVALVGRTGSGKSTLAALLLGLYEPQEGEILYDGTPLREMDYRAVRSQFGVVLQEPFLFSGSVRQNIAFHDAELPLEKVVEAARLADVHDEVARMPMGYETLVSEGGAGLSGGQRQRLSLARALAPDPAILLLDEATSSLDAVTEERVERNLNALSCTRIVIAHRMSTVRNADQILVMENGGIAESGSHHELLARKELYASLVQGQRDHAYGGTAESREAYA